MLMGYIDTLRELVKSSAKRIEAVIYLERLLKTARQEQQRLSETIAKVHELNMQREDKEELPEPVFPQMPVSCSAIKA